MIETLLVVIAMLGWPYLGLILVFVLLLMAAQKISRDASKMISDAVDRSLQEQSTARLTQNQEESYDHLNENPVGKR